jgi:NAD(P)-dependent dehydrogenase (short-subunit alcohol dehydrogenase family)
VRSNRYPISVDLQLKKKLALVTGSTAGIGYSIAEALAKEGASIIVNGRTQERVDRAIAKLRESVGSAEIHGMAADLGSASEAAKLIERFPDVDILVNNLAIFEMKPFEQISDEDWLRFFEVNVMSGVRLGRHYLPRMKNKNWGRIIFISSESGLQIPGEMVHYGMTKTAQLAVARGMAETTAGTNVTVNAVLPGPTASEGLNTFVDRAAASRNTDRQTIEKEFFRSMRPSSLLKRFETTEEIAAVVAFICSPLSSAINGAAVRADGGVVRSIG